MNGRRHKAYHSDWHSMEHALLCQAKTIKLFPTSNVILGRVRSGYWSLKMLEVRTFARDLLCQLGNHHSGRYFGGQLKLMTECVWKKKQHRNFDPHTQTHFDPWSTHVHIHTLSFQWITSLLEGALLIPSERMLVQSEDTVLISCYQLPMRVKSGEISTYDSETLNVIVSSDFLSALMCRDAKGKINLRMCDARVFIRISTCSPLRKMSTPLSRRTRTVGKKCMAAQVTHMGMTVKWSSMERRQWSSRQSSLEERHQLTVDKRPRNHFFASLRSARSTAHATQIKALYWLTENLIRGSRKFKWEHGRYLSLSVNRQLFQTCSSIFGTRRHQRRKTSHKHHIVGVIVVSHLAASLHIAEKVLWS